MTSIANAILAIDSTAQISTVSDNSEEGIWHDGNPNGITAEQIPAKQAVTRGEEETEGDSCQGG